MKRRSGLPNRLILVACVLLVVLFVHPSESSESSGLRLITTASGELGADNFTYYELKDKGNFKLVLVSLEGDADLYVSSKTQFVDYTNYELQSTTYGVDEVLLSHDMKRPVYISVYAHPYYVKSVYKLYQYAIPSNTFVDNEYNHFDNAKRQSESSYDDHVKGVHKEVDKYDEENLFDDLKEDLSRALNRDDDQDQHSQEESLTWSILLHILQFIAEVLL